MKEYTAANIATMGDGTSVAGQNMSFATVVPEFYGVDHRRSFVAGKNSVEVVGQLNEIPEDIWSMDVVEQCVYKGHDYKHANGRYYEIKKFATYKKDGSLLPSGNIQAMNSMVSMGYDTQYGYNIKFEKFKNDISAYGGCIAVEKCYSLSGGNVVEGDNDFTSRIITMGNDQNIIPCVVIHTNFFYTPDQNSNDRFYIKGSMLTADSADDIFEKQSGLTYSRVIFSIGDQYYDGTSWGSTPQNFVMAAQDGEIKWFLKPGTSNLFSSIDAPSNLSGEVILELCATTLDPSDDGPGDKYVAFENLKVQLVTYGNRWRYIEDKSIRGDVNEDKVNLNNGFADKFSQSCGLTLAREDVPACNGVVLKSDLTLPTYLYDNKYPEKALCDRVADYAAQSRMVLYAVVKGEGAMLSPLKSYAMRYGGRLWICLCQTVNWQNNEIMAGFFEPSYEYVL
jgi:hypothetical protein